MNIFVLAAIVQLYFTLARGSVVVQDPKRVVCYYFDLNILHPEDINATLCTHLVLMRPRRVVEAEEINNEPIDANHNSSTSEYSERLLKLKDVNPNLKLLLFASSRSITWDAMTPSRRLNTIQSGVALLKRIRFDGLEFMNLNMLLSEYTENIADLFCEMQSEFDKHGFTVSAMLTHKEPPMERTPIIDKIARCCDFISISTMDFWDPSINSTTLLSTLTSVSSDVDKYLELGFPSNKLLVAIPAFALIATLANINQTGLGANISGPTNYEYANYHLPYQELLKKMMDPTEEWTIKRDEENDAPYAYSKSGLWTTYDDASSVATKARYVLKKNLGGATLVSLETDDFEGIEGKGKFPLTRAIYDTFNQGIQPDNSTSERK